MLVRAKGTSEKLDSWSHKMSLELPVIYLDDSNYDISLRMIFFDCQFLVLNLICPLMYQ